MSIVTGKINIEISGPDTDSKRQLVLATLSQLHADVTEGRINAEAFFEEDPYDSLTNTRLIDVVFDGPPGPESGRFVEVENVVTREGMRVGEWVELDNGLWALRLEVAIHTVQEDD